jgi:hypothetical protein
MAIKFQNFKVLPLPGHVLSSSAQILPPEITLQIPCNCHMLYHLSQQFREKKERRKRINPAPIFAGLLHRTYSRAPNIEGN